MDPHRSIVRLPDGRALDVLVGGADASEAFVLMNGSPTGVVASAAEVAAVTRLGLRFVTFGRPGYADSTRVPGRVVADVAADLRDLATILGITRVHIVGWSGGGPHSLACAALLPDLVAGVATIGGVAPFDAAGLDWLDGMAPENHEEFEAAVEGAEPLQEFLEHFARELRDVTGEQVADELGGLVPDVDRAALTGEAAEHMAALFRDGVRTGIWGWFDDDRAFVRDWGFDLDAIGVPATIWQGSEDRMVPFAHGRWLAEHLPGAKARLIDGEGHLSLGIGQFDRIVAELVAGG